MRFIDQYGHFVELVRLVLGVTLLVACAKRAEPPGATAAADTAEPLPGRVVGSAAPPAASSGAPRGIAAAASAKGASVGTTLDNLPFDENGPDIVKVASIAWRSWIYTDT